MEINEAILHITGSRDFDEYKTAMKKLLPAYEDVKKRAEEGKLTNPQYGICHHVEVSEYAVLLLETDVVGRNTVTEIMAYLWPETHNRDIFYSIAGSEAGHDRQSRTLMDLESLQLVLLRPLRASTSQQRSNAQSDACAMPRQGPHQ